MTASLMISSLEARSRRRISSAQAGGSGLSSRHQTMSALGQMRLIHCRGCELQCGAQVLASRSRSSAETIRPASM